MSSSPLKVDSWLAAATTRLEGVGIGTARLDALVLLEDATGKDRGWLLAHPEFELTAGVAKELDGQLARRSNHEPLAYIRGFTEFFGRRFAVDQRVLEPRPETETMIDLFKTLELAASSRVLDVGCGSGAIGITVALERPGTEVTLLDIEPSCLAVTQQNLKQYDLKLKTRQNDLLKGLKDSYYVILANLPYVPDSYTVNQAALQEPKIAIFGGKDGLNLYRQMFAQLTEMEAQPRYVLTEALPFQHAAMAKIAEQNHYTLRKADDFIQLFEKS